MTPSPRALVSKKFFVSVWPTCITSMFGPADASTSCTEVGSVELRAEHDEQAARVLHVVVVVVEPRRLRATRCRGRARRPARRAPDRRRRTAGRAGTACAATFCTVDVVVPDLIEVLAVAGDLHRHRELRALPRARAAAGAGLGAAIVVGAPGSACVSRATQRATCAASQSGSSGLPVTVSVVCGTIVPALKATRIGDRSLARRWRRPDAARRCRSPASR